MAGPEEPPQYTKYRSRPSLADRLRRTKPDGPAAANVPQPGRPKGPRRPVTWKRVAKWLAVALAAWIGVSLLLFLVSAQIEQGKIGDATENALDPGPFPLTGATNVLVLGSDTRPKGSKEPGADTTGNGRSDSILLLRVGGGKNSRMSIARDTVVDIPGHGRQKINAAYALGGAPLAIDTIKAYLGIEVNHIIEVSFSEFPDLVDAMGGIDYKGGCVVARINGGARNGGVTLRIRAGKKTHLDGKKALALARVRKNDCNRNENDLTRARRQQKILAAMKGRVFGIHGFARAPWISWQTPRTFRTDMSGPTLSAVFANLSIRGTPETVVLGTVSGQVPEELKRSRVEKFLDG
ncbi:MAG TPA: LCP family protein [Solirubrobacteraceae bacterium]|nr:LCP family protein [Solirubrobacteraceae bacterium]